MKVHQIFPDPVYISKLERVLTKEELNMVHEYRKKIKTNAILKKASFQLMFYFSVVCVYLY